MKLTDPFDLEALRRRSEMLARIRTFFAARGVWEVDTPLLYPATATDPYIHSFHVPLPEPDGGAYLQTSPEFAMKRLLALGSGSIYQIAKAFRQEESGRLHRPEFTLLEWYRLGFDHKQLMDEVDALLQCILATPPAERWSYQAAFLHHVGLDPHRASLRCLQQCLQAHAITVHDQESVVDRDLCLQLLLSEVIEPHLGVSRPLFLYDFPASQAALARITTHDGVSRAERFECYVQGIELANGYHELLDAQEQRRRFEQDLQVRRRQNTAQVPLDHALLEAMTNPGLPPCAGVALGIDRLLMLSWKTMMTELTVTG